MIRVTLGNIVDSYDSWKKLGSQVCPSAETKFRLIRVAASIEKHVKRFENVQLDLLKSCGKRIGLTERWEISPDKKETYDFEYETLRNIEVEIPGKVFSLETLQEFKISPIDVVNLSWLIEFDESDPEEVKEEVNTEAIQE
jgi:hypothetical protein